MGRGPKDVHSYLIGDLLVVRLTGVLTAAEQHLVKSIPADNGRNLLKQVRIQLIETAGHVPLVGGNFNDNIVRRSSAFFDFTPLTGGAPPPGVSSDGWPCTGSQAWTGSRVSIPSPASAWW